MRTLIPLAATILPFQAAAFTQNAPLVLIVPGASMHQVVFEEGQTDFFACPKYRHRKNSELCQHDPRERDGTLLQVRTKSRGRLSTDGQEVQQRGRRTQDARSVNDSERNARPVPNPYEQVALCESERPDTQACSSEVISLNFRFPPQNRRSPKQAGTMIVPESWPRL